jgi:hypothetical protein
MYHAWAKDNSWREEASRAPIWQLKYDQHEEHVGGEYLSLEMVTYELGNIRWLFIALAN